MISFLATIGVSPFDTNWLGQVLILSTPILLAGIGELVSERAGVVNVGLEGMMLSGAFFAYLVTFKTHSLVAGVFGGLGGGMAFGVVMGLLAVEAGADQIVAGVAINLAALGLTGLLFVQMFSDLSTISVPTIAKAPIPLLSKIPSFGPALFDHDPLVYLAFALVPISWFLLFRTHWGLSIRAAGELPVAADAAGVSVRRVRWMGILVASALAGVGGADLSIVQVGIFHQDMSAGLGFLGLVAVIFGRWRPSGVLAAALVLGGVNALELRVGQQASIAQSVWGVLALIGIIFAAYLVLSRRRGQRPTALTLSGLAVVAGIVLAVSVPHVALPDPWWVASPYIVALFVLAASVTRSRMPAHLAIPYHRGGG